MDNVESTQDQTNSDANLNVKVNNLNIDKEIPSPLANNGPAPTEILSSKIGIDEKGDGGIDDGSDEEGQIVDDSPSGDLRDVSFNKDKEETAKESENSMTDYDIEEEENAKEEEPPKPKVDFSGVLDEARPELDQLDYDEDDEELGEIGSGLPQDKETANDDKTNKKEEEKKAMSDGEIDSSDGEIKSDTEDKKPSKMPQGFYPDDFEEGEMVDPIEGPAVPREICRFFERGSCTWGDRCRFIHPGINDKGSYNMFDEGKPPPNIRDERPPPMDPRGFPMLPGLPPEMMPGLRVETAWERGLRHAKEMRKRSMQRKVNEPDFMRKREVISLNEALNVDRDMDYIAQKPLVDEDRGFDPFNAFDDDDRYAVPPPEELKRYKRFDKTLSSRGRSPNGDVPSRHPDSPRSRMDKERRLPPPGHPIHRDMHERDRRSPPRHMGMGPPHPHDRHQPPPMHLRDQRMPSHQLPPHRHDEMYRDGRSEPIMDRGRHERDYRDRRMDDMRERDYRADQSRNLPPDDRRAMSPTQRRREVESRVVAVGREGINDSPQKSPRNGKPPTMRGDNWSDPWARGRHNVKKRASRSGSESSDSSSSSSSRSSNSSHSGSSFSSRSSSRSSFSSSFSSSGSSRSPSPKKVVKKVMTKKKATGAKIAAAKALPIKGAAKVGKPSAAVSKQVALAKKPSDVAAKAKLVKPTPQKPIAKLTAAQAVRPLVKTKAPAPERGRPVAKAPIKKTKPIKRSHSSSSSEFSHTSSSESRSRSRSKGKGSGSDSDSGSSSSSGSDSYSSSSGSSSDSSDEEANKKTLKPVKGKAPAAVRAAPLAVKKLASGKVAVPSKPGRKNVKMTIINKAAPKPLPAVKENRKRPAAAAMPNPSKKGSAIATRRVELLEQLKVVENAILKKRAKLA